MQTNSNSIPIFVNNHAVGKVKNGVFYKPIKSGWYLQKPPAIAFDLSSLDDAERLGAQWVEVKDRETGRIYRATLSLVRLAGFSVNRGYGNQWGLCLSYFSVNGQPPRNTPQAIKTAPADIQPRLL